MTVTLIRLLRTFLGKYRKLLGLVLAFTFVQTMCTLLLPTLNADIIDKGVLTGNTDYIWKLGGIMLGITIVQVVFAVIAIYYGSRAAMAFGRDVRGALFHRVTDFSAQDVASYGAPSLITRITNDVTQVQILVLMSCTLLVAAPITIVGGVIFAVREDGPLSLLLLVSIPVLVICVGLVIIRMVPQFQVMQERIDRINQVLREQITGIRVVRAFVREPDEAGSVRRRQRRADPDVAARRQAHGVHVPDRHARAERIERRRDLARCGPHRQRRDAGRRADRVPELPDPDPHVRDDGHVRRGPHPARQGRARTGSRRSSTRSRRSSRRRSRSWS